MGSEYTDSHLSCSDEGSDIAYEKFVHENPSTAGMMEAVKNAQLEWERDIVTKLKDLKGHLKAEEWALVESTQKKWTAYRDLEMKSIVATTRSERATRFHAKVIRASSREILRRKIAIFSERPRQTSSDDDAAKLRDFLLSKQAIS